MIDLPSHRQLAEEIADDLLNGNIVVLLGRGKSGRSVVSSHVTDLLQAVGYAPCVVDRSTSDAESVSLLSQASQVAKCKGSGVVVVDDFGARLQAPEGDVFQARLTATVVDGSAARDIGALLIASPADALTRTGLPGSPVADAAHRFYSMPVLSRQELVGAVAAGSKLDAGRAESLIDRFGGYIPLLEEAIHSGQDPPLRSIHKATMSAVTELHAGSGGRLLDLAQRRDRSLPALPIDRDLPPLIWEREPGRTGISMALAEAGLADLIPGSTSAWPSVFAKSTLRFRARIYGAQTAYWVDRYFGSGLSSLVRFLDEVANTDGSLTLRLLGSSEGIGGLDEGQVGRFRARQQSWRARGLDVQWRIMQPRDYVGIHDRQLVFPHRSDGFHLPPCDRLTGKTVVGNENDAYLPQAAFAVIEDAWTRAAPFPI